MMILKIIKKKMKNIYKIVGVVIVDVKDNIKYLILIGVSGNLI